MITSLLVANRGEIACRVFRTCRELGIGTVAVHSDADAGALHVREADAAVRLPGSAPAETYLRGDLIVRAALAAGADAVHPGYGFLSENAEFARAVLGAGLVWVGPPPAAIEAMASKTRAKELMAAAGVPLLAPVDRATAAASDLPLLLKAAAGGGGRGMRLVRALSSLPAEWEAASAEARSAFGDGEVFAEPYVEHGRHVEVQIVADAYGTVWPLGTRDCSLQRRHQKVIEESPAPGLPPALRTTLSQAAVAAARAVDYRGAGTVEFLVAADGGAYFLEMNTRLQVEHPVTEEVFGVDLVALQLAVAQGAMLPPDPPAAHGHAVEARLYAEDPSRGWAPQAGVVHALEVPGVTATAGHVSPAGHGDRPRLRLDSGYGPGDAVGVHYDAMLAKVVAWAPTRTEAVRKLAHALRRARVHGPLTNREVLVRSLLHPDFGAGRVDTGFYERHLAALNEQVGDGSYYAAVAATLSEAVRRGHRLGGWRSLPSQAQVKRYAEHEVRYRWTRGGFTVEAQAEAEAEAEAVAEAQAEAEAQAGAGALGESESESAFASGSGAESETAGHGTGIRVVAVGPHRVSLEVGGVVRHFDVADHGDHSDDDRYDRHDGRDSSHAGRDGHVYVDSAAGSHRLRAHPRFTDPRRATPPGSLLAPMPGTVVRIADGLKEGCDVTAGQPLVWLEAMKMEHRVTAPTSGTLTALHAVPGRQVEVGTLLAVVSRTTDTPEES